MHNNPELTTVLAGVVGVIMGQVIAIVLQMVLGAVFGVVPTSLSFLVIQSCLLVLSYLPALTFLLRVGI
jgi:hypothetical protein